METEAQRGMSLAQTHSLGQWWRWDPSGSSFRTPRLYVLCWALQCQAVHSIHPFPAPPLLHLLLLLFLPHASPSTTQQKQGVSSGAHPGCPRTPPLPSPCSQLRPHLASVGAEQSWNHRGFSEPLRLTHLGPWCLARFKMQAGPSGRYDSGPPTDARLCSRNKGSILKQGDSGPG